MENVEMSILNNKIMYAWYSFGNLFEWPTKHFTQITFDMSASVLVDKVQLGTSKQLMLCQTKDTGF